MPMRAAACRRPFDAGGTGRIRRSLASARDFFQRASTRQPGRELAGARSATTGVRPRLRLVADATARDAPAAEVDAIVSIRARSAAAPQSGA